MKEDANVNIFEFLENWFRKFHSEIIGQPIIVMFLPFRADILEQLSGVSVSEDTTIASTESK